MLNSVSVFQHLTLLMLQLIAEFLHHTAKSLDSNNTAQDIFHLERSQTSLTVTCYLNANDPNRNFYNQITYNLNGEWATHFGLGVTIWYPAAFTVAYEYNYNNNNNIINIHFLLANNMVIICYTDDT